jgi:large subunit ribosomal protein L10
MRSEKTSIIDELRSKVKDSAFLIIADYQGLNVGKTEELKRRLHGVKAQFQVIQNRMFKRVVSELSLPELEKGIAGPSAMIYGKGDVVQAAKVLKTFIKENNLPAIKIGSLDGTVLSAGDVESLAGLPAREVLLAIFVGTVAAPLTQLVGVLQQKVASVVYVLKAIQEKKEKAA